MKLIIAGGRDIKLTVNELHNYLNNITTYQFITEVVCGMASGVDTTGKMWAQQNNIPVKECYANWEKHGRAAGPIRNKKMAEYADILLLIWDGKSKGSASMKSEMNKLNKPVFEIIIKPKKFEPIRGYWSDKGDDDGL